MLYLSTFFYYTLFASTVLIYGIGINSIADLGISKMNSLTFFLKAVISILSTSILTWLITNYILVPLKLVELFPLLAFLIFVSLSTLLEAINRVITGTSTSEFIVSFLIVLISILESTSLLSTIIICLSCFTSLIILVPFCYTFKNRITNNGHKLDEKYYSLFFVFLALLVLLILVWDISWLSKGVIK